MTFQEITQRRIALQVPQHDESNTYGQPEPPDWQRVFMRDRSEDDGVILRQRCGGGYRVLRKKIGGA